MIRCQLIWWQRATARIGHGLGILDQPTGQATRDTHRRRAALSVTLDCAGGIRRTPMTLERGLIHHLPLDSRQHLCLLSSELVFSQHPRLIEFAKSLKLDNRIFKPWLSVSGV